MMKLEQMRGLATKVTVGFLAAILVLSSYLHLGSPYQFISKIHAYGLTSPQFSILLAFVLPILQITLGIGLVFSNTRRIGAIFAFMLFLVFCTAQGLVLAGGESVDCGCFGRFSLEVSITTITFSGTMAIAALFIWYTSPPNVQEMVPAS